MNTKTHRNDGLDNAFSPNGPHPLYYINRYDAGGENVGRSGPYGCVREAELQCGDHDEIVDHHDNMIERE